MTRWAPVKGFEGRYEVSDRGEVWSRRRRGAPGGLYSLRCDPAGYPFLTLHRPGYHISKRVHTLVLQAFVGERPPGMLARHKDGDPANNRLENLVWGTPGENNLDQVRHGTHAHAKKTHCPRGHPYDETNIYRHPNGERRCRICGGYSLSHLSSGRSKT